MCSFCERQLYGSASCARLGKYYPAYHCNKRGHHFRVPKKDFEDAIFKFVRNINLSQEYIDTLVSSVTTEWNKRYKEVVKDYSQIDETITKLQTEAKLTVDKIKLLTSAIAIKYLEEDLLKIEQQVADLLAEKQKAADTQPTDMRIVMAYIKYFLEHMEELLLLGTNSLKKAEYFGVLFDKVPTYAEINSGTADLAQCIKLKDTFYLGQGKLAGEFVRFWNQMVTSLLNTYRMLKILEFKSN